MGVLNIVIGSTRIRRNPATNKKAEAKENGSTCLKHVASGWQDHLTVSKAEADIRQRGRLLALDRVPAVMTQLRACKFNDRFHRVGGTDDS